MRRLHLFELEDFPWFPATIRDLATDYLRFIQARFRLHMPIVPLLRSALEKSGADQVVDLCSGGGGPALALFEALQAAGRSVPFLLTDKYPNLGVPSYPSGISYVAESVDATSVPANLPGFRTIFNAFHHFAPEQARAVLESAVNARQPVGIFEIPERALSTIVPLFFTPVFMAISTPFIRPFRWHRLLWTYLIPLVPLMSLWDGIVSQLRAYTTTEMLELTRGLDTYDWTAAQVDIGVTPGHLTWLTGIPKKPPSP